MVGRQLGVRAALVDGEIVNGDVAVDDGSVAAVGVPASGGRGLAVPGFVDTQVNGFAGVDFATADAIGYATAAAAMAATGVTAFQPTLISLSVNAYSEPLAAAAGAQVAPGPRLLGLHLEGPFLSPERAGAHDPDNMIDPDLDLLAGWLEAGPVSYVTLAPERAGALDAISFLVDREVVVAVGHSDAGAAVANEAFDRGATAVTHLFSAQRPLLHRAPGIAGAALVRDDVCVSVILDGHHLAPEVVRLVLRAAPGRVVLITDAIAAAGMGEGDFPLGDRTVQVRGTEARLPDGTLAGSVLTMDQAVRNLVEIGADVVTAVEAASATPARLIGLPELGTARPGTPADITVVDDGLSVLRTLVAGVEVYAV